MVHSEWIAILDFGSQYSQLIARRIREQHVYSELIRFDTPAEELARRKPSGIILSGGPASVLDEGSPLCDPAIYDLGIPILGICYGMQMTGKLLGGSVVPGSVREFGSARITIVNHRSVFKGLPNPFRATRYHSLVIERKSLPDCLEITAWSEDGEIMGVRHKTLAVEGVQFHPESILTEHGHAMLANFLKEWV